FGRCKLRPLVRAPLFARRRDLSLDWTPLLPRHLDSWAVLLTPVLSWRRHLRPLIHAALLPLRHDLWSFVRTPVLTWRRELWPLVWPTVFPRNRNRRWLNGAPFADPLANRGPREIWWRATHNNRAVDGGCRRSDRARTTAIPTGHRPRQGGCRRRN